MTHLNMKNLIQMYKQIDSIETPNVVVDFNILVKNIDLVAEKSKKFNLNLRPHIKVSDLCVSLFLYISDSQMLGNRPDTGTNVSFDLQVTYLIVTTCSWNHMCKIHGS